MSTKSTLTYGQNFHLYLDNEDAHTGVWLEINQPHDTVAEFVQDEHGRGKVAF